jgi:hypothetical protein
MIFRQLLFIELIIFLVGERIELLRKTVSGMILAMLLTSMLMLPSVPLITSASPKAEIKIIPSPLPLGIDHVNVIGQNFTVACVIENITNLFGFDIKMYINTTYFAYVRHQTTVPWNNSQTPVPPSPYAGILYAPFTLMRDEYNSGTSVLWMAYSSKSPAQPFNGSGTVCIITLRVINQPYDYEIAPASWLDVWIKFVEITLLDKNALAIPCDAFDCDIQLWSRPFVYPAIPTLRIRGSNGEAHISNIPLGGTFWVDVWLQTDIFWDIEGFDMNLTFDPTIINAIDVQIFWEPIVINTTDNTNGFVRVAVTGGEEHTPVYGTLKVVSVKFNATYESTTYPPPLCLITLQNTPPRPVVYLGATPYTCPIDTVGFPHSERAMSPWNSTPYSMLIPSTIEPLFYTAKFVPLPVDHDVAVTNVSPSKTVLVQGDSVNITVTVKNQGNFIETFNVTAYANTTVIAAFENIILARISSLTLTFEWNTTDMVFGRYRMRAEASTVPGEIYTINNILVDGAILVEPNVHDVAITDVKASSNFAYAGDNVSVYVVTLNRGTFLETFNVTAYADKNSTIMGDEITIGTQSLCLQRWSSCTLTFIWNTAGVSPGNYTISAVASNVSQEADPTDNSYVNEIVHIFASIPCYDINITCPSTLTINPSILTYDPTYQARLINIGNVSIKSTGYEGSVTVLGSKNGTIRLCIGQPDVCFYTFFLPLQGEVQVPLWLMFQPETHWEAYNGNFTLQLTIGGIHRIQLKIVGISINVCQNGAYIVNGETATFTWNLTGGSWVYLEAETNLPLGWFYSVDPSIGSLFETPHIVTVNITAPPDAKEGEMGSVTLKAYKNGTDAMIWQFVYFASTDSKPPTIEAIQPPKLTFTGDLLFNVTVKDRSGIGGVQLYYSVNDGPWNNQSMQWSSGDTFNFTLYTLTMPRVPDNSTLKYYVVATDWLRNQIQSDIKTTIVKYDSTITEVRTSKTVVGQGLTTQINVTIANNGTIPNDSLKIFVYANTKIIYIQTIPFLTNGTAITLTFYWNTTGFAYGNYTISAYVQPVPGETNTQDNTLTGSIITVTIPGDVDGDHWVFLYDAVKLLSRYGAKIGDPQYDPVYDIDNDGRIFLYDAVILLSHYGQRYP